MRFDEFDLPLADGVEVHVRRWRPDVLAFLERTLG
jgi:hypothetical protein